MREIICDQCGREILTDYIKVEGYGVFCDDDCLADALLQDVKDGGGNYEEVEYEADDDEF